MAESSSPRSLPPILIIFLTIFIDMVGFGIVIPILPLYAKHFGAEAWQIGLLFGSFSLMQLIFAPLLGRWSDRYGRRPVLLLSILGTALGFLVLGFANTLWMLFLGRIIDGISGGNISTAQAYIADVTPLEKRSAAMGIIGAAFGLGFVFGPALGGLLGHYSLQLPFWVAAGMAVLNAIALFFFLPETLTEKQKQDYAHAPRFRWNMLLQPQYRSLHVLMLCSLLSTIAFSLVTALFTLFTENRLDWHVRENGLMFVYIGLLGVLIQGGLLRRLVPRTGEKPLIILGCVSLALSMILLPFSGSLALVVLASTGLSIGNSLVTPLLSGLASQSTDPQSQGMVLGVMQSVASFGQMVGPAVGGFLLSYDALNPQLPYGISPFLSAAVLMIFAVGAARQLRPANYTASVHSVET